MNGLKSKFVLKKKMKEAISGLRESLKALKDTDLVEIIINGLPDNFPLSLVLDLLLHCGGKFEEVQAMWVVN